MEVIAARLLVVATLALAVAYRLAAPPGSGFAVLRVALAALLWAAVGWRLAETADSRPRQWLGLVLAALAAAGLVGAITLL
jgi:hypothetical protein